MYTHGDTVQSMVNTYGKLNGVQIGDVGTIVREWAHGLYICAFNGAECIMAEYEICFTLT